MGSYEVIDSKQTSPEMSTTATRPAWYRRKRFLAVGSVSLLIIVGLAVGLGVGLSRRKSSNATSSDSSLSPAGTTPNPANRSFSIWQPAVGTQWQIVLQYALNDTSPNVPVYDIDLFSNPRSITDTLHALGRKVICYISAGSFENYRPDAGSFKTTDYGKPLSGWTGEFWLDIRSQNVRNIMAARMDLAVQTGCDGIDPDNIDGFENDTGFPLTMADAVDYLTFLAGAAHSRNLSIGLKNGASIVSATLPMMQWQINEQCVDQNQCQLFRPFIDAGKPVFHIEYPPSAPSITADMQSHYCTSDATAASFSTVLKRMSLDNWMQEC